jgi:pimeloyl-ACP methyl ester carboxylesterase
VLAIALSGLLGTIGDAWATKRDGALTEPPAALARSLECHGDLRGAALPAVILVHGTGSSPKESFSFGYAYVLRRLGFAVCTVRLPDHGVVDLQRSIQYVVHAIRTVARRSGRKVSLIGHSQGAVLATYAPYFWPDLPTLIDDVIGLGGPYRGSTSANPGCADSACPAFAWQLRPTSNINRAFGDTPKPAGPSFTAIATAFDQRVTPAPQAGLLAGASNVALQDICPGRPVDHFQLLDDAVAYALAIDALTHPGPADPARVSRATCLQTTIPGSDDASAAAIAPIAIANAAARTTHAPFITREPTLRHPFAQRTTRPRPGKGTAHR